MQMILVVVLVGLIGGAAVGLQGPLANLIGQRLGSMESVFILHFSGTVIAGALLLIQRGGALARWRSLPWYALLAGGLGLVIVSAINYTIPRIGATTTVALVVAGQLIVGILIDHFGLLSVAPRPIDLSRLLGIAVLGVGVYLLVR